MPTYVVLLRAVNVGKRVLKMEHARQVVADHAVADVATPLQTGNLLVTTPLRSPEKVERAGGECLSTAAGFDIVAMARRPAELTGLVEAVDGIPASFEAPMGRYVAFCAGDVGDDAAARIAAWDVDGERAHVVGRDILVELGKPFNEAKLGNAQVERLTGRPATSRNLTVVRTLAQKWGTPR
jgi:uncharacterized protein (DUF1697 family)